MQIELPWIYALAGMGAGLLLALLFAIPVANSKLNALRRALEEAKEALAEREEESRNLGKSLEEARIAHAALAARQEELQRHVAELRTREEKLTEELKRSREQREDLERALEEERIANAALSTRVEELGKLQPELNEAKEELNRERAKTLDLEKELSELRTRLEEEREQSRGRLEELRNAREGMQKEFRLLAGKIMEENSSRFGELSKERVEQVLKPLQQQVSEFRRRIEKVHDDETKEMATLMHEIRGLKELNQRISEDAVNLTRALRGESKRQGVWGEMVLERVLEASGLREGEEYEREVSLQNEEKKRYRPDVVVHLPDRRDIIIDAKTSLVAYERYVNAEKDEDRALYARHHLEAVRKHIDGLSRKSYGNLEGVHTLDFVFMFMPIEGALMLALQEDPGLYDRAFSKHIVLVSPTTLLVALRAVENTWRRERQNRNALEIARRAGALYDKFVSFAEDLEKLGKQLTTAQKTYDTTWRRLTEGRGNIVRQVEGLKELGARASKKIPDALAQMADLESESIQIEEGNPEEKSRQESSTGETTLE